MSTGSTGANPQGGPLLDVRGLDVGYGDTQVLWDVSLDVGRGEVVALVGANGAGKSTLLAAISGLLRPWRGEMLFNGEHIERTSAARIVRRGLVHVPQGRHLFAALSVEGNLKLGAYTRRAGSAQAIAEKRYRPASPRWRASSVSTFTAVVVDAIASCRPASRASSKSRTTPGRSGQRPSPMSSV